MIKTVVDEKEAAKFSGKRPVSELLPQVPARRARRRKKAA